MPNAIVPVDIRYPGVKGEIGRYLDQAIQKVENKSWDLSSIWQAAENGRIQLWAVVADYDNTPKAKIFGALATVDIAYPLRRSFEVLFAGADGSTMKEWLPLFEDLKQIARDRGADVITGSGRCGWERVLKAEQTRTVWECEV